MDPRKTAHRCGVEVDKRKRQRLRTLRHPFNSDRERIDIVSIFSKFLGGILAETVGQEPIF